MTPDERCQRAAAARFGLFTREEALAAGLSIRQLRHRVRTGKLEQHPVKVEGKTFYLDFAYPTARLGIEAHSFKHHSKREDWEHDQVRHALLTTEGWTILYVTWRRLRDHPEMVVRDISQALERFERLNDNKLAL